MFVLVTGEAYGIGDDGYIAAYEAAEAELDEKFPELEKWLKENIRGRYSFEEDYDQDIVDIRCSIILLFEDKTDAVAFKLQWM